MISQELNNLPDELDPKEELVRLARKSKADRNELLLHTLKAATRYASCLARGKLPLDELVSLTAQALIKAIRNYKVRGRAVRLIIYSKAYIKSEISRTWRFKDPLAWAMHVDGVEALYDDYDLDLYEDEGGGPDFEAIDLHERWARVEPHLHRLSETERRVLVLTFEARLSGPVVGKLLGFTRANVHEVKLRALKKLRAALYRDGVLRP